MTDNTITIKINVKELQKKYDEHASHCKKIAKEVEKWGKKTKPDLSFLKAQR
ncbi:hypothetical protein [uncultured Megasphaera sp.]|jgi:hypothetical protein|uniref:hypothetical protein n=1 Tax=uncultured Megasphaera sp. TaxID=165188 RepID=UPI00267020E1|nr:hypothetical protein [uncultured Megasphaera sp.]